jgi:hypothetical protein
MENEGNCIDGMILIRFNVEKLRDNLNFDTQDNLDKCVNDFSDYLSKILSPFVEVKPYSNTGKIHKRS